MKLEQEYSRRKDLEEGTGETGNLRSRGANGKWEETTAWVGPARGLIV